MFGFDISPLSIQILGSALLIFLLRIVDVSMGTVRLILITRGFRKWAVLIGFVEITIWIVAVSQVLTNLTNVWSILGYSGGFAIGTLVGMWIESTLALGNVDMHIISMKKGSDIVHSIREAGYGATELQAMGQTGPVTLIDVIAPRKDANKILQIVNEIDPTCFITIEDAQTVVRGYRRLAK